MKRLLLFLTLLSILLSFPLNSLAADPKMPNGETMDCGKYWTWGPWGLGNYLEIRHMAVCTNQSQSNAIISLQTVSHAKEVQYGPGAPWIKLTIRNYDNEIMVADYHAVVATVPCGGYEWHVESLPNIDWEEAAQITVKSSGKRIDPGCPRGGGSLRNLHDKMRSWAHSRGFDKKLENKIENQIREFLSE